MPTIAARRTRRRRRRRGGPPRSGAHLVLLRVVKVGKEIERPGDEDRAERARPPERFDGIGDRFHMLEVRFGARRRVPARRERAGCCCASRRRCGRPRTGARAWRRRPCREGSTRRSSTRGAPAARAATRRPRSCARRRGPRRGRAARAGPAARSRPAPRSDDRRTPRPPRARRRRGRGHRDEVAPLVVRQDDRRAAGRRRRASRARSPRACRRGRRCARGRHSSGARRERRARSSRRAARRGRLRRPPRRRRARRSSASAAAVSASNCVAPSDSAAGRMRATARSNVCGSVSRRSCQPLTCGEVYTPTSRPSARNSAAIVRAAVDLPFVPTTCTDGNARCGLPSASRSARIRPSPNSSGHGDSDATHSVAVNEEAGSGTRGARRSRRARRARRAGSLVESTWRSERVQPRSAPQRASACRIARAWPRRRASGA